MKKVTVNWSYEPGDYFRFPVSIEGEKYILKMYNGEVEFVVYVDDDKPVNDSHSEYFPIIESYFLSEFFQTKRLYKLEEGLLKSVNGFGKTLHYLESKHNLMLTSSIKEIESFGKHIMESEQKAKKRKMMYLTEMSSSIRNNPLLKQMMRCLQRSVENPDSELTHLYEIRDALFVYFGGQKNACTQLNINTREWSRLGEICNELPLMQGRHAGRKLNELRDATAQELSEARSIAVDMIKALIQFKSLNK